MRQTIRNRLYLATIADDALELAEKYGLGIETDAFCDAAVLDTEAFVRGDWEARRACAVTNRLILHAPFNELHPCAIDLRARALAMERFEQAWALCQRYGIRRMVVHSGFLPYVYYDEWFVEQSAAFWRRFLADKPADFELLIENVLDKDPGVLAELARQLEDPRIRLCLDIGHANIISETPVSRWLAVLAPWLGHLHVHNNDGARDWHRSLGEGTLDVAALLQQAAECAPRATVTIENMHAEPSVLWLIENGFLEKEI